jgi:hypothetical protein
MPAPHNASHHLSKCIGETWNQFPLSGILHHGQWVGEDLSKWAKNNGVDMKEVYAKLDNILQRL